MLYVFNGIAFSLMEEGIYGTGYNMGEHCASAGREGGGGAGVEEMGNDYMEFQIGQTKSSGARGCQSLHNNVTVLMPFSHTL